MLDRCDADLNRLAEALTALLAEWWRRQTAKEAAADSPSTASEEHYAGVRSSTTSV
jgi:hypothetical protein